MVLFWETLNPHAVGGKRLDEGGQVNDGKPYNAWWKATNR